MVVKISGDKKIILEQIFSNQGALHGYLCDSTAFLLADHTAHTTQLYYDQLLA